MSAPALGNVRPLADRIRSKGDRETAEVSVSLQDQIDELNTTVAGISSATTESTQAVLTYQLEYLD